MGFAENLKEIRNRRNITQEQLAEILSVSRQTISKWESGLGYPETEKLLSIAKEVFAYRSTCLKRKYGAVIVKDDVVISTGYNGAPRGFENCCDIGKCPRIDRNMHQGEGYGIEAKPCPLCARTIIQAGIRNVYLRVGEGAENYVVVPAAELKWVQETRG